jgi:hypothetical protein
VPDARHPALTEKTRIFEVEQMSRCKAGEILPNKAYVKGTSLRKDEDNAAMGVSSAF